MNLFVSVISTYLPLFYLQGVAETQFLVTPLTMYGGKKITDAEARQVHEGPMAAQRAENKPDPVSSEKRFSINYYRNSITGISNRLFGFVLIVYQNYQTATIDFLVTHLSIEFPQISTFFSADKKMNKLSVCLK